MIPVSVVSKKKKNLSLSFLEYLHNFALKSCLHVFLL